MSGVIYKITNTISGNCYIGQTKRTLAKRWYEHKWVALQGSRTKLSGAIRKYGEDSFVLSVLEANIPKDQLDVKEIYYIGMYDSFCNGYNLTIGGNCFGEGKTHLAKGHKQTDEHKAKISAKNKGKPKEGNSGTGNQAFKVWSYISPEGACVICTGITKKDWANIMGFNRDVIKSSIREGRPIKYGKAEGYQFFGGGAFEGVVRAKAEKKENE